MRKKTDGYSAGFTLIEFIVTLVVAAVIAAMFYAYYGVSITESGIPVTRLQTATDLTKVMDNIVADYNRLHTINLRYKWKANTDYSIGSVVVPAENDTASTPDNNGHYYRCTIAGKSGNSKPAWPTGIGDTVNDGSVTWQESGLVRKADTTYSLNDIVIPYYNNGHYYRCTVAGKSAIASEATGTTWDAEITPGTEFNDGTITWTEDGTILERTTGTDYLKYYLTNQPTRYGTGYTIVASDTRFVKFDSSNNEASVGSGDEKNTLKVTIRDNSTDRVLTTLFTTR